MLTEAKMITNHKLNTISYKNVEIYELNISKLAS